MSNVEDRESVRLTALGVVVGDTRLLVPRDDLVEVVLVAGEERHSAIESIGDTHVLWLRDRLVPLLLMREELGIDGAMALDDDGTEQGLPIVIVQSSGRVLGLAVDEILDSESIELQSLPEAIAGFDAYVGSGVVSGDGVGLVLDVPRLAERAGNVQDDARDGDAAAATGEKNGQSGEVRPVVLLRVGPSRRLAIPLEQVTRLEVIKGQQVERTGSSHVVQYRGKLMEIMPLSGFFGDPGSLPEGESSSSVIVVESDSRLYGLVVDEILDIVDAPVDVASRVGAREGLAGAVLVQERVTDLIDPQQLVGRLSGLPEGATENVAVVDAAPEPALAGREA